MAYTYIPTKLLTEYATQYDQIIVRYRQPSNSGGESRGGLLMLSDPAAKTIQVQSLCKTDSIGRPIVFPLKINDDMRFSVQPHHLKALLAKYEHVNGMPHPMASFPQLSLHVAERSDIEKHRPLTPPKSAPSSPRVFRSSPHRRPSTPNNSEDDASKGRKRKMSETAVENLSVDSAPEEFRRSPTLPSQRRTELEFAVKRARSL